MLRRKVLLDILKFVCNKQHIMHIMHLFAPLHFFLYLFLCIPNYDLVDIIKVKLCKCRCSWDNVKVRCGQSRKQAIANEDTLGIMVRQDAVKVESKQARISANLDIFQDNGKAKFKQNEKGSCKDEGRLWLLNYELVDIIKLIPIFKSVHVMVQWLKFWPSSAMKKSILYHLIQFDRSQVTGPPNLMKCHTCPRSQVLLTKSSNN